ncbi:MAG: 50S ribosomal protein L24 [Candidatus Zixiibacteriota bacterium]|nr:MAG: 50S ribosomal protein L24 [candidate division Zixibacteria bacterium]
MNIKKGDIVYVRRGKDRGKTGKILHVFTKTNRVIVEGINLISRHTRPTRTNPKGGIVRKEAPIHRSNVAFYSKSISSPTKVSYRFITDGGRKAKIRICRKTGEQI